MKKTILIAALFLGTLNGMAQTQEKVLNIQKTDGTTTQTRVAELDEISFLTVNQGGKGLIVKTTGSETVPVLFEANPVVSIADGLLKIKSDTADPLQIEITNIAEIVFGDATDPSAINSVRGFSFILQDGGALIKGIPADCRPSVCTIDGRVLPTPPVCNGELHLNRASLGKGVFVVKIGSFSTKIKL